MTVKTEYSNHDPIIPGSNQNRIRYLGKLGSYQINQIVNGNYFLMNNIFLQLCLLINKNLVFIKKLISHFVTSIYSYTICIGLNTNLEFAMLHKPTSFSRHNCSFIIHLSMSWFKLCI